MNILLYNIFQVTGLILVSPLLLVKAIISPKYRGRVLGKLGFGLEDICSNLAAGGKRVWLHALSVGEVLSAEPLVKELRAAYPDMTIVFSASTKTGEKLSREVLAEAVDLFVPFPFDVYSIARKFINCIKPDLFILIETDFWPNFLHILQRQNTAAILVNGRISRSSFARYQRFRFLFLPMFRAFRFISMQTAADTARMVDLGVDANRVKALGNLKYDAVLPNTVGWDHTQRPTSFYRQQFGISPEKIVWIAGSTHAGEDITILSAYKRLSLLFPDLFLVIAPRKPERGREVKEIAENLGLTVRQRSVILADEEFPGSPLLILDTMGELTRMYSFCDIAFVGGSLVADGGHNPLEPAAFAKPVLFGPYMDDFIEISADLLEKNAAIVCHDENDIFEALKKLLVNTTLRREIGDQAQALVLQHRGVTRRHLEVIHFLLG
ncbi:MAG: 3-deoxy-D-manno-octulosonic acid transferase [Deltaproteobacteria bacterium]|jgi:3-deoxy-D-manno-octulosonic-acid transferase|nr:3-deoxy-D-manno-octulosonic acid transferase [Deltaproteobacteria bacterium]